MVLLRKYLLALILAPASSPWAYARPSNCSNPARLVDLGYAKHIPTYINATESGNNVSIYKNIRFGNPPVGNLRFRKPDTNLPKEYGIQDGHVPWANHSCISTVIPSAPFPPYNGTTWGHEDCLFLDVYVPEGVKLGDKVPVLHWFFGSAYTFFDKDLVFSPMGLFNGSSEASKFIFVANNYRLGMPGWTSAPGLDMDVNVGLHDCLAAAKWTSKYIERFGGDPNRVTVMGQSAGAGIIDLLTTLNGGEGTLPFQQAFVSSPDIPPRRDTAARREKLFQLVLDSTNCTDLACLRSIPESAIIEANKFLITELPSEGGAGVIGPSLGFGPVPDGDSLPDMPEALFRQGRYHKELRGLIIGSMANEGMGLSSDSGMPGAFPSLVRRTVTNASNETIAAIQAQYTDLSEPAQLAWDWTTDSAFACNGYNLAAAYKDNARRYIMSIPPGVHGQDQFYFFFVDQESTPVSNPELVPEFQERLLKFVHGTEIDWPVYGDGQEIINITVAGFERTGLPENLKNRCELLNDIFLDPVNGV